MYHYLLNEIKINYYCVVTIIIAVKQLSIKKSQKKMILKTITNSK